MPDLIDHENNQCQGMQSSLVQELSDVFETEKESFENRIQELQNTILEKEKTISQLLSLYCPFRRNLFCSIYDL